MRQIGIAALHACIYGMTRTENQMTQNQHDDRDWIDADDGTGRTYECAGCALEFKACFAILRHVENTPRCRDEGYGPDRFQELKLAVQTYRQEATDDKEGAELHRIKRMSFYHENKGKQKQRAREYYARNKAMITARRREMYKQEVGGKLKRQDSLGERKNRIVIFF